MKKNLLMRIGLLLFVTVMATSGIFVGSGTYAKYYASGAGSAEAQVAKFEVLVGTNGGADAAISNSTMAPATLGTINLLGSTLREAFNPSVLENNNTTQSSGSPAAGTANDVRPDTKIAPGTAGYFQIKVTNNSEVAVGIRLTSVSEAMSNVGIKFLITDNDAVPAANAISSTNFAGAITAASGIFTSNTFVLPPTGTTAKTLYVWWIWPYAGNDANDTALGVAAGTVSLNYKLEAIQLD